MAWYPGAIKMELQPESDQQPAIKPTQFIVHSVVAPWDETRIYSYWRESTSLESHFGLDYDGSMGQYIGTETRADANASANRRADGTGAVSIETASNTQASDPWTPEQIEQLIRLGVWLHRQHGIPLRICRSHSDPGYGFHRLYREWSTSGTACPGEARVRQFNEVVFPGIVARATGTEEEDPMAGMTPKQIADAVLNTDGVFGIPEAWRTDNPTNTEWKLSAVIVNLGDHVRAIEKRLDAQKPVQLTDAQVAALAERVAAHPALAEQIAEKVAAKIAERIAE